MYNDYDVVRFNKKLYFFGEYIEDDMCILINLDDTENDSWYYLKTLEFVMSYEEYRLDKVLSKFEEDTRTIERKVFLEPHDDNYILIDYDQKIFYLVASHMNYEISLETVESLLRDLGVSL